MITYGEYEFSDYLDDDVETKIPLRVSVVVKVEGSDITLDFSKCDPQVGTAFNLITGGSKHSYLYQGLLSHIISEDPYIPFNGGLTFPIHVIAPEGTLVNAQYPSAGGIRHPISLRLYSAVQGALAKIIPDHLQAAGGGQVAVTTLSLPDIKRGGAYAATVIEPLGGGGGAQYEYDGINGIDAAVSFIRNTPIESLEERTDILIHSYKFIPNTGGGWGNPLERDANAVLKDVKEGLVDIEHAKSEYGVVIINNNHSVSVDEEATGKLREELSRSEKEGTNLVDFGQSRKQYESVWSSEASDELAILLQRLPASVRSNAKHRAHNYFEEHVGVIKKTEIDEWFNLEIKGQSV